MEKRRRMRSRRPAAEGESATKEGVAEVARAASGLAPLRGELIVWPEALRVAGSLLLSGGRTALGKS
jgi:hypothetical protein